MKSSQSTGPEAPSLQRSGRISELFFDPCSVATGMWEKSMVSDLLRQVIISGFKKSARLKNLLSSQSRSLVDKLAAIDIDLEDLHKLSLRMLMVVSNGQGVGFHFIPQLQRSSMEHQTNAEAMTSTALQQTTTYFGGFLGKIQESKIHSTKMIGPLPFAA